MGEKSLQKKKHILETARKVFIEKGYKRVTMKDIVDACGISRGGLYLYFNNTGEIFLEVMKMDNQESGGLLPGDCLLYTSPPGCAGAVKPRWGSA